MKNCQLKVEVRTSDNLVQTLDIFLTVAALDLADLVQDLASSAGVMHVEVVTPS